MTTKKLDYSTENRRGRNIVNALDVANFFVNLYRNSGNNDITNLKLNKLVYFAQGYHLARYGTPLFAEEIEAWKYGAIIPSVYAAFQVCGDNVIQNESGTYSRNVFTPDEIDFLLDIDAEFGVYSAYSLVELTHKPGSPWSQYHTPGMKRIIQKESMKEYYADKSCPTHIINTAKIPAEGRRREDGKLVLPAEDYCKEDDDAYLEWKEQHA
ncbi:MAG TPA: DUF4065 domain-containing protein [Methanocorpusculum sp.]|nr:DUF4065 domain-containing protein [Methanocorpusculum sp.]